MFVKAIRTDSWLGIKTGEIYPAKALKGDFGEKVMVSTKGYEVLFNEEDFVALEENNSLKNNSNEEEGDNMKEVFPCINCESLEEHIKIQEEWQCQCCGHLIQE